MAVRRLLVEIGRIVGGAVAKCDPLGVAQVLLEEYGKRADRNQLRVELEALMQLEFRAFRDQVADAMKQLVASLRNESRRQVEAYLWQLQVAARQGSRILGDSSATTVPETVMVDDPAELAAFLPQRLPQFRVGAHVPGAPSWRLVEPLGSGGFGEVWKGRHQEDKTVSAFKFFFSSVAKGIRNEAATLTHIHAATPSDGVVRLLGDGLNFDPPWLQFEFLEEGDLSAKLARWAPPSVAARVNEANTVIRAISATIAGLHDRRVIHRDLKPSNILLRPSPEPSERPRYRPVIADFGISHVLPREVASEHSGLTSKTRAIRAFTAQYASPQQRRTGSHPDARDDVYALGVLWYQMLVQNLTEDHREFGWQQRLRDLDVSDKIIALLEGCLHQDENRRWKDARELCERLKTAQRQLLTPKGHRDVSFRGQEMRFALCPAGTFDMGSEAGERDERPVRRVTLTRPFCMGIHPVTQGQWRAIMGDNPSECKHDDNRPVEMVSWLRAREFCEALTNYLRRQGAIKPEQCIRLPTEAEWEYACRAGTATEYHTGEDEAELSRVAWFHRSPTDGTRPVGAGESNAWGLYDMHGNVWEWCADWYAKSYALADTTDPCGPATGDYRVHRGGAWKSSSGDCRSARRKSRAPGGFEKTIGFRVCFTPE